LFFSILFLFYFFFLLIRPPPISTLFPYTTLFRSSIIAKYFSQPEPLCYHKDLLSPLGRFLEGMTSRAVVSRDALMALFYHLYGFGQGQVVRILGLGIVESQRVYKNFERWRQTGWQRAV